MPFVCCRTTGWTCTSTDEIGTVQGLLAAFPASVVAADAELAVLMAAGDLDRGIAPQGRAAPGPRRRRIGRGVRERRGRFEVSAPLCGCNSPGDRETSPRSPRRRDGCWPRSRHADAQRLDVGDGLRALALISLGQRRGRP